MRKKNEALNCRHTQTAIRRLYSSLSAHQRCPDCGQTINLHRPPFHDPMLEDEDAVVDDDDEDSQSNSDEEEEEERRIKRKQRKRQEKKQLKAALRASVEPKKKQKKGESIDLTGEQQAILDSIAADRKKKPRSASSSSTSSASSTPLSTSSSSSSSGDGYQAPNNVERREYASSATSTRPSDEVVDAQQRARAAVRAEARHEHRLAKRVCYFDLKEYEKTAVFSHWSKTHVGEKMISSSI